VSVFGRAREFVYSDARVLEQRVFESAFEGASAVGVVDALLAYRNDDGGFGHGLEPDKRCPDSQPLDVQFAFEAMDAVGLLDAELARRACDFLATVAGADGLVPIVLPSIAAYPRAEHWRDGEFPPTTAPASAIAAFMHKHGAAHSWVNDATASLFARLEEGRPDDAHALRDALLFLEHVPDRTRAEPLIPAVADAVRTSAFFKLDPGAPGYGVTPLFVAPRPESRWRLLFSDDEIAAHLDHLVAIQQHDGGWPLSWTPPSQASELEWRGFQTVTALRVLRSYGRLEGVP
jgi:hypothetical protein